MSEQRPGPGDENHIIAWFADRVEQIEINGTHDQVVLDFWAAKRLAKAISLLQTGGVVSKDTIQQMESTPTEST